MANQPDKSEQERSEELRENLEQFLQGEGQAQTTGDEPSQTGKWSANPKDVKEIGKLPKVEPDNMPGDTEVQSKTIWQRY